MTDYISREAALKANCYFCSAHLEDDSPCAEKCADYMKFMEIPAADVRPVARGKWRPYSPLTDTYECDKCGYQVIDESFRTNFCPNCGADMREEHDD